MDDKIIELISNYKPSDEVAELVENTNIVLLCGITGAGKDTVKNKLLERESYEKIVTSTTRAPRENDGVMEQDGREYHFFTTEQAIDNVRNQRYFEVAVVHGRINGVTADEIRRHHDADSIAIGDVDYQGIDYFKKYAPSTLAIFLIPPSFETWMDRLKKRYDTEEDFAEAWPERRKSAVRELEWVLEKGHCHILVNDDLEKAVEQTGALIHGEITSAGGRPQAEAILADLKANI